MDACDAVGREVDKVTAKFKDVDRHTGRTIQDLLTDIIKIRDEVKNEYSPSAKLGTGQSLITSNCLKRTKDGLAKVSASHRELHGSVSKVGKSIDRNFVSDFSSVMTDSAFDGGIKQKQLNNVICEHFLRQGMLGIAETLVQDSKLDIDSGNKEPFLELHRILEALREKNLQPALRWAMENRIQLQNQFSSLEFKLHRLHFINLVQQGSASQAEALRYAHNLAPFAHSHTKELQELMGSLLFMRRGIEFSPYSRLLEQTQWVEICDVFTRDACCLLGLSVESPLSVVIRAGCSALPPLLNIKQVMKDRQCPGVWSAKDELPVEIDMGQECRYHSIFACPILRQQSTDSNPPVRLVCGHVISRDALNKLANGNKVKCPYCPLEQSPSDARCIYF